MVLQEDAVAKVVPTRIYSVAVHPSESSTLVAAGDKQGHVGLWNVVRGKLSSGVHALLAAAGLLAVCSGQEGGAVAAG